MTRLVIEPRDLPACSAIACVVILLWYNVLYKVYGT